MKKFIVLFLFGLISCNQNIDCKIVEYKIIDKKEELNIFPGPGPFHNEKILILQDGRKIILNDTEYKKYNINDKYKVKVCKQKQL